MAEETNGKHETIAVLEKMDESVLKEEIKTELVDEKVNIKTEKELEPEIDKMDDDSKTGSSDVENSLTMRKEFSSENFKIEVKNLPKFWGVGQMKKLFEKQLELKYHR